MWTAAIGKFHGGLTCRRCRAVQAARGEPGSSSDVNGSGQPAPPRARDLAVLYRQRITSDRQNAGPRETRTQTRRERGRALHPKPAVELPDLVEDRPLGLAEFRDQVWIDEASCPRARRDVRVRAQKQVRCTNVLISYRGHVRAHDGGER
jgi:hypothetical protein